MKEDIKEVYGSMEGRMEKKENANGKEGWKEGWKEGYGIEEWKEEGKIWKTYIVFLRKKKRYKKIFNE
jgi:hypothetical protein